jgi:hypothetical protein
MSNSPSRSIAEQLTAANVLIFNSLVDPEIQALVAGYGYSLAKLNEGRAIYEAAMAAVQAHKAAMGTQKKATLDFQEAEKEAQKAYRALAKIARAISGGNESVLTTLGLTGEWPNSTAKLLTAAYTLFDNAVRVPALADYGYESARLEAEREKIVAFDLANQRQEAAKGATHQTTRGQAAALAALAAWKAQYLKIASVALLEKPHLLEKIGAHTRARTRATPHAAPEKAAEA